MPGYLDSFSGIEFGWALGEDGWGGAMNRSLRHLAYIGTHKQIRGTITTPPASPVIGDLYIVGNNASGWSFNPQPLANQLVIYGRDATTPTTVAWQVIQPRDGWSFYDLSRQLRQEYKNAAWTPLQAARNQPILVDQTTMNGDGVDTALSPIFPAQQPSDWNATSGPTRILNKPPIPTQTEPLVLWQSGNINLSTSVNGERTWIIGRVRLSQQAAFAHDLDLYQSAGDRFRLAFGARVTASNFRSSSRLRFENSNDSTRWSSSSGTQNLFTITNLYNYNLILRATSTSNDNFQLTGQWWAGLVVTS